MGKVLQIALQLIAVAVTVSLMDLAYLSILPFRKVMETVQAGKGLKVRWTAAVLCYTAIIAGVVYFSNTTSVLNTALIGLLAYGIYELTNAAVFSDWPWWMVLVDTLWGGILFLVGAAVATGIRSWVKR